MMLYSIVYIICSGLIAISNNNIIHCADVYANAIKDKTVDDIKTE